MASVFLSYSREDAERVRPLAVALEREGHDVWWDRHISGGEEYSGVIEQALAQADAVVVCWTAASVRSAWVRDEAAVGRDTGRLVPVTLDGCEPPLGFRQFQLIDLSSWNGRARSRTLGPLRSAITEKSGSRSPAPKHIASALSQPKFSNAREWTLSAAVAVLLIFGGVFLYSRLWAGPGGVTPKVAVGSFVLVSPALPRELPDMLAQEVVSAFGAENAVSVVAAGDRTAGKAAPFVMNGSIGSTGEAIRFTVNLQNAESGVVMWSNTFEQEGADAIAARQVAVGASQVIRCGLWGASSHTKPMSDEALSLYFKWCNEHWTGSGTETAELDAARKVTVAVPTFSFGWSALALAAVPLAHAAASADSDALRAEAIAAAQRSIALDKNNPEGFMAIAGLLPLDRYAEREGLLKKAISVRPTECGCERQAYGDFLASVGRMEEAAEQYERARAMRPLAPFSNLRFAEALYVVGRTDEADRVLGETLELWPQATSLRLLKIKSALWTRRYDEAIELLRSPDLPLTSTQRSTLATAFAALKSQDAGFRQRAVSELEQLSSDTRRNDQLVVAALAALGARDAALNAASNLLRSRGLLYAEVLFEPNLASASNELSYAQLVHRLGLARYWRTARIEPDICRGPSKPRFCAVA